MRNAILIERQFVDVPASKLKIAVVEALRREGFIWDYEILESEPRNILRINLKYGPNGERVIQHLRRVSKPGRRVYVGHRDTAVVLQGLGASILSTNQGVLSDREARQKRVGGEVLCEVW